MTLNVAFNYSSRLGDRRRRAALHLEDGGDPADARRGGHRRAALHRRPARSSTCSSARAATSASATSCSGRPPTRSSTSATATGPTSDQAELDAALRGVRPPLPPLRPLGPRHPMRERAHLGGRHRPRRRRSSSCSGQPWLTLGLAVLALLAAVEVFRLLRAGRACPCEVLPGGRRRRPSPWSALAWLDASTPAGSRSRSRRSSSSLAHRRVPPTRCPRRLPAPGWAAPSGRSIRRCSRSPRASSSSRRTSRPTRRSSAIARRGPHAGCSCSCSRSGPSTRSRTCRAGPSSAAAS